jgi:hypothetical protein
MINYPRNCPRSLTQLTIAYTLTQTTQALSELESQTQP